jgi:hypothetical protein
VIPATAAGCAVLLASAVALGAPPAAPLAAPAFPVVGPDRLSHTFEPSTYRAHIAPGDHTFTGRIEIDGVLDAAVSLIWLHGDGLTVWHATASQGTHVVPLVASPPRRDQLIGLAAAAPLPPGR